jgi:hypothetical protein
MKMQILDDAASVYEEPDLDSPLVATLESATLFDSGNVEKKGKSSWVNVVLPDGTHGYLDGETRSRGIRKFRLEQEAIVHETWSDASPVTTRVPYGGMILVGRTVPNDGKEWVEVFDCDGKPLGFTGPVFRAEQCDDITTIIKTARSPESVMQTVIDAVRQEKWKRDPQTNGEIIAHTSPNPFNGTNGLNVLIGLLRFCFWPLIYGGNSEAKIFPAKFTAALGVTISIHPKGGGSVVLVNATPITFLGSPMSHSCTTRLINCIKTKLSASGQTPSPPPAFQENEAEKPPNQQAAPLVAAKPPMIRFACPRCKKKLKAPVNATGRKTHCPDCRLALVVPAH